MQRHCGRGGGVIQAVWKRWVRSGVEETGEAPVWKRRGRGIQAAWTAEQKGTVQIRARETKMAWAARESKRPGRSRHGLPDASLSD
jgi:hypothetical protein